MDTAEGGRRDVSVAEAVSASWGSCSHPHQAKDWIQERAQRLGELPPPGDLKDQLRHLRKHPAFQAEVQAHEEVTMSAAKVTARPSAPALPKVESQDGQWERP